MYLATQRWNPEQVGIALTIGGLAGVVTQIPAGGVVDRVHGKRLLILGALTTLVTGALLLALWPKFEVVVAAQLLIGGSGAFLIPTANAITLGLVGPPRSTGALAGIRVSIPLGMFSRPS